MKNKLLLLMVAILGLVTMAFKNVESAALTVASEETELFTFASDTTDTEDYDSEEIEEEVEEDEEDSAE